MSEEKAQTKGMFDAIMNAAHDITTGKRQNSYGDMSANHRGIAALTNAYINIRRGAFAVAEDTVDGVRTLTDDQLDEEDMMVIMSLVKIGRFALRRGSNIDTVIDAVAYLGRAGEARASKVPNSLSLTKDTTTNYNEK